MKTILPCPGCNEFFLPPASVRENSTLRCPGCGQESPASSIVKEISPTAAAWVIEGLSPQALAENEPDLDGVLLEDTFSAIDEDHGFDTLAPNATFEQDVFATEALQPEEKQAGLFSGDWLSHNDQIIDERTESESSVNEKSVGLNPAIISGATPSEVPQSNEWETQPSSLEAQESNEPFETQSLDSAVGSSLSDEYPATFFQEFSESRNVDSEPESSLPLSMELLHGSSFEDDSILHESSESDTPLHDQDFDQQFEQQPFNQQEEPEIDNESELVFEDADEVELIDDSDVTRDHLQTEPFQFEETSEDLHSIEHESDSIPVDALDEDDFSEVEVHEDDVTFDEDDVAPLVNQSEEDSLTLAPLVSSKSTKSNPFQSSGPPRKKKQDSSIKMLTSVVGGGFASIPIALLLMWYMLGTDPFKLGPTVAQYVPWIVPKQFAEASGGRFRNLGGGGPGGSQPTRTMPPVQNEPPTGLPHSPPSDLLPSFSNVPNDSVAPPQDTFEEKKMAESASAAVDIASPTPEPIKPLEPTITTPLKGLENPTENPKEIVAQDAVANPLSSIDPSASIDALRTAIDANPESSEYYRSIYDAMEKIGNNVYALHTESSPALSTWHQAALKVISPLIKTPDAPKNLLRLRQASIEASSSDPTVNNGLAIASGFNAIKIGDIKETDDGEEWISSPASQNFWKGTRILVPSFLRIKGQRDKQYLVIGAARPTTDNELSNTTDFIVLFAIPR